MAPRSAAWRGTRGRREERGDGPHIRFPEGLQKSLELFSAWQLKQDGKLPLRIVYLVESPFCVAKFHQMGLSENPPYSSDSRRRSALLLRTPAVRDPGDIARRMQNAR
jgi:hypothetical protein